MEWMIPQNHADIEIQSISITELTNDQSDHPPPFHFPAMRDIMEQSRCAASALEPYAEQSVADARLFIFISPQLLLSEAVCAPHPAGHAGPAPSPGTFDWPVCFFAINPAGRLIINVKIHCSISGGSVCSLTCLTALSGTLSRTRLWFIFLTQIQPQDERTPTIQKPNKIHGASIQTGFRDGSANVKTSSAGTVFIYSPLSSSKDSLNLWHQFTLFNWIIFTLWNSLNMNDKCVFFLSGGLFRCFSYLDFDHTLGSLWHLYNEFAQIVHPVKLEKQKCAVFCKNVFISIATSASRLSVLTNAESRTQLQQHCRAFEKEKNDYMSFKVLQCDWNGPTLHLCPVNILSKWDLTHL